MIRRRNIFLSLKTVVSVFGLMGCEEFAAEPIMCTKEMRPGIVITITDKDTGTKVTGSTITLQDGDYVETLTTTSTGAEDQQIKCLEPGREKAITTLS